MVDMFFHATKVVCQFGEPPNQGRPLKVLMFSFHYSFAVNFQSSQGLCSCRRRRSRGHSRRRAGARVLAAVVRPDSQPAYSRSDNLGLSLCALLIDWDYAAGFVVGYAGLGAVGSESDNLAAVGFLA